MPGIETARRSGPRPGAGSAGSPKRLPECCSTCGERRARPASFRVVGVGLAVGVVEGADLGGDGEAGRDRQAEVAHLGEVLVGDRLHRGLDRRLVAQVVVPDWLELLVQLVDQRHAGGDVELDDLLRRRPRPGTSPAPAGCCRARRSARACPPDLRCDRLVPVGQETRHRVLQALGPGELARRQAGVARVARLRRGRRPRAAAAACRSCAARSSPARRRTSPRSRPCSGPAGAVVALVQPPGMCTGIHIRSISSSTSHSVLIAAAHRGEGDVEHEALLAQQPADRLALPPCPSRSGRRRSSR